MNASTAVEDRLLAHFVEVFPAEFANLVERSQTDEAAPLLASLPALTAARALEWIHPRIAGKAIALFERDFCSDTLGHMDPGRAATALTQLEDADRERVLGGLDEPEAAELRELMSYPAESAGSLMDTGVPFFRSDTTVNDAFTTLRQFGKEMTDLIVVTNNGELAGQIPVPRAAVAQGDATLGELVTVSPAHVMAMSSKDDVTESMSNRDVTTLPVVDASMRVLGIIDHRSLMRTMQEQATAQIQTMVGASREERALSSPWFAIRKRLPWLNINLLTAFLAAAVVGLFEDTIAKFTALAVLLPVVAGQSGNTGAQALAVVMRGLALREIRLRHTARVLAKEGLAGLVNGIAIALVTCLGVLIWSQSWGLTLVIGLAMIMSMTIAALAGAAIPMILTTLRQDPAQSGSIILTTVTDVAGFFSFLGLATAMSQLL